MVPKVWDGKPGDQYQFKCYVTGTPPLTIKWTKNSDKSLPDDVVDLDDGVLEISNAKKEVHEGTYTCTVTNDFGSDSDTGVVNIHPSLAVVTKPHGPRIHLTVGEPLEVECKAFGEPDPEVEWLMYVQNLD